MLNVPTVYRKAVIQRIRQNENQVRELLNKYPSYFLSVLDAIMSDTSLT